MSCKDCKCGKKNVDLGAEAETDLSTVIRASQVEAELLRKQLAKTNQKPDRSIEAPELQYVRECYDPPSPWWKFWDYRSGVKGGIVVGMISGTAASLFLLGLLKLCGG